MDDDAPSTRGRDYAERLQALEQARWKRLLDVQRPYRWNLRRLVEGRVLDAVVPVPARRRRWFPYNEFVVTARR